LTAKQRIAFHVGIVLVLVAAVSACVSRSLGPQLIGVPAAVPLSELSGITLQVGDQKGGTQALLRAANALDNLPYRVAFSTFTI
jgi:sulfonate transport system substrate-binding protein